MLGWRNEKLTRREPGVVDVGVLVVKIDPPSPFEAVVPLFNQ